jgi:hypothetical protein
MGLYRLKSLMQAEAATYGEYRKRNGWATICDDTGKPVSDANQKGYIITKDGQLGWMSKFNFDSLYEQVEEDKT